MEEPLDNSYWFGISLTDVKSSLYKHTLNQLWGKLYKRHNLRTIDGKCARRGPPVAMS